MPESSSLDELYAPIARELEQVREQVTSVWRDVLGLAQVEPEAIPAVGGKLLRPAFCLLAGGATGAQALESFIPMASSMELFHMAALAHDDVIDGAALRRGGRSLNAMWNDHAAVLGGDYLVARGVLVLASYDCCPVVSNAIQCIRVMAEGELTDFGRGPDDYSREACIRLARAKTASLFGVACSTPALYQGSPHQERLYEFGLAVGTAFQIIDDLLDLTQDAETLGKPAGGDISEGKKTLPILYLRESLGAAGIARMEAMRGAPLTEDDRVWIASELEATGTLSRVEEEARRYAREAIELLAPLPPGCFRDAMAGLAEFILVRGA